MLRLPGHTDHLGALVILAPFPQSLVIPCRRCGGSVIVATTSATGSRILLDAEPDPSGNQAVRRDHTGTVITRQLKAGEEPDGHERRMMPHVPTCRRRQEEAVAAGLGAARAAGHPVPARQPVGVVDLAAYRSRRRAGVRRR